jgi:CRISPR-associated protein Cas5
MSDMDLSFFLEPPKRTATGKLVIEALKPLSMTTAQPGTYYRSQPAPTEAMLYGMIENALGWHFPETVRKGVLKGLRKAAKKKLGRGHELKKTPWITGDEDETSGSGFQSLLQHHLAFPGPHFEPATVHFDDLWARHVHGKSTNFPGGSRYSDYRVERIVNLEKSEEISFTDNKITDCHIQRPYQIEELRSSSKRNLASARPAFPGGHKGPAPDDIRQVKKLTEAKLKVHVRAIRPSFPMHYDSPTPREYVIPARPYQYRAEATPTVASLLADALEDPAAPLYLGTNDGWVNARWEPLDG